MPRTTGRTRSSTEETAGLGRDRSTMQAIKRHALGLGVILFVAGAFLAVAPVTASGFGCGSTVYSRDDTLRRVEVRTAEGDIVELPSAADLEARSDCHDKRRGQTTLALCLGVAGLIGVFWSVVGAPEGTRRRDSRSGLIRS